MGVSRSTYRSPTGGVIITLEVPEPPMGSGSGYIPPPIIVFFKDGQSIEFAYQGQEMKRGRSTRGSTSTPKN